MAGSSETVNLIDRQVEVYSGPSADAYSSCITFKPGQSVPVVIDGVEVGQIAVADILPRIGGRWPEATGPDPR